MSEASRIRQKRSRRNKLIIVSIAGIIINIIGAKAVTELSLPIYLDSVGTVLASVLSGYIPGMIVGLFTNLIKGITDIESVYYALINVLIALVSGIFAEKGLLRKWWGYVLLVFSLSFIGGCLGSVLIWLVNELKGGTEGLFRDIIDVIPFDILDKLITVAVLIAVTAFLPKAALEKIRYTGWQQKPLSSADVKKAKEQAHSTRHSGLGLRAKILALLISACFLIGVVALAISTVLYRDYTIEEHKIIAQSVVNLASTVIDPSRINEFIERGREAPGYAAVESRFYHILESSTDIEYIYVYKMTEEGIVVVFDLDTPELKGDAPGTLKPYDESFRELVPDLLEGKEIPPVITNDTYGWLITVYKPMFDRNGNCSCYVAADISMGIIRKQAFIFFAKLFSIFLGFFTVIIVFGMWISEYNIVLPINTMSLSAGAFAYDSESSLEDNVENIKELDIRTGDEIEHMYQAFSKTTEDSLKYASDLKTKTETLSKTQNALIMVLADIVESRDQETGDHVRKTAAYTRIIMEKMRELGYYEEQLTDRFMYDVEHSAPLHDIGKIKVSDTILNKPGKLTDEEYEIMKTHTTAGAEIIEQAIQTVPDSQYLNEAKNLAEFHHEKWNGKGYPHGISGEDIPLSARIMAVADVFDALVSERCYKKAFTFEQAMDIIKKDAGSHFDPKVADAFIQSSDRVREIALHFSEHRPVRKEIGQI